MTTIDAQQRVETYLGVLRREFQGFDPESVREIIEELRSHILEKSTVEGELTSSAVEATIDALGDPQEIARQYATDSLLAGVEASRSPLRILASVARWASLSVAGFFVFVGAALGYFLGTSLMLCALLKAVHPRTAGIWRIPNSAGDLEVSIRLGFGVAPAGGKELLGWWIVPIGLLASGGLFLLITLLTRAGVRYSRRHRVPGIGFRG